MSMIDENVVAMKFNNGQFEAGVKQTINSLDGLKKGLKLDGATQGLEDIDKAASKFSLAGIAQGVETIASKFSALSVIGITALANITSKAVDAGLQFAKSFSMQPLMDGFREYETNMNSIQTILANTSRYGTNLQQVNASLDELNTYADKTIYSFSDMTSNIGLFTNAGIRVEDATQMIKGFSNAAAASGTSAQGAAGAAYQLSQALSAGTIRLMDWRSLTNVGMGNKNMQEGLIQIADAMGTLSKNGIDATTVQKDFNGSLEKNWLSADVMSSYLRIMAGDMDAAQMSAMGLSDATIQTFIAQQKTAEEAATKVRTLTQLIGTVKESIGSSWGSTFRILFGDFTEATDLFTNMNNTIGGIVGKMGDARNQLLQQWKDLGGRARLIQGLSDAFGALMEWLKPIAAAFREIFPPVTAQTLMHLTTLFAQFTQNLYPTYSTMELVKRTFAGVFAVFDIVFTIVGKVVGVFAKLFGVAMQGSGTFLTITATIGDWLVALDKAIKSGDGLTKFFDGLTTVLAAPIILIQQFGKAVIEFFKNISDGVSGADFSPFGRAIDSIKSRLAPLSDLGKVIIAVFHGIGVAFEAVYNFFKPVAEAIGSFFSTLGKSIANSISTGDFSNVLDVLNTGLFAGIVLAIRKFFKSGLNISLDGGLVDSIKSVFGGLTDTLKSMQEQIKSKTLLNIAIAVGILAASLVALSLIDSGKLTIALGAITVLFGELTGSMALLEKVMAKDGFSSGKMAAVSLALVGMATAMLILAGAIAILASLSWEELARGLVGVAVGMGIMVGAVYLFSKVNPAGLIVGSAALVIAAVGLTILAGALKIMATLSWDDIARSMVAMGASLAILSVGLLAMSGSVVGSAALIIASVGLIALAGALLLMAQLSWDDIGRGMATIGASLAILAVGLTLMTFALPGAAALVVASVGLIALAGALLLMAKLSWDDIGRGMVVMGASLAIMAVGLTLMIAAMPGAAALVVAAGALTILAPVIKSMGKMSWDEIGRGMVVLGGALAILAVGLTLMIVALPGAAALLVAAAALAILVPLLGILGNMSWDQIGTGLGAMAAALGILAAAGVVLLVALPGLLGLGVAMMLIGAGALMAGIGIMAFSVAITALSIAGAAGVAAFTAILSALIAMIPQFMVQLAMGVVQFIQVLVDAAPQFLVATVTLISTLLTGINTVAPQIVTTLWNLITMLVNTVVAGVPFLVDAGMKLLVGIVNGIANNVGQLIDAATNLIVNFLNGITRNLPKIIEAGKNLIIAFINGIQKSMNDIADAAMSAVVKFVNTLADSIRTHSKEMQSAGKNLASAIIDGMTGGLRDGVGAIISAAKNAAASALNAAKNFLGIHSPSREFYKIGDYSTQGFANGLLETSKVVERASASVGDSAISSIKKSMSSIATAVAMDIDTTPTIRPVLDLTNFQKGASLIGGMLTPPKLAVDTSFAKSQALLEQDKVNMTLSAEKDLDTASNSKQITFIQNNNSPKALPDAEIYRNTKNALSVLKGEIDDTK